ncbi:hypothetical protein CP557_11550 [Natrinema ejinorense]|uniref:Uncharacterized protein n=1 Tax=Natrinema ejinorense TaxID=373386 RepID=A0A2A5R0U7_9EURY|nr:hypothetical protein CP557_11550 [Natrinema ejinorense]
MTRNTILTLVLVASLLLVGFAGTAAASGTADTADTADVDDDDDNQLAAAAVVQNQEVAQVNDIDQNANQTAEQEATGFEVTVDDSFNEDNEFPFPLGSAADSGASTDNVNDNNDNGDGISVEIGTTGDQTIEQNISQSAEASNTNSQVGTASAANFGF